MLDKSEMIFGFRAVIDANLVVKEIHKFLENKEIQSNLS